MRAWKTIPAPLAVALNPLSFSFRMAAIGYGTVRFTITSFWPPAARVAPGPRSRRAAPAASRTFMEVSR
jgi:hypothetical protein